MDLSTLLKDYGAFNYWANHEMVEWMRAHPAELLDRELKSSFPTIKLTLLHIWTAEDAWLCRLMGIPHSRFLSEGFTGDLEAVFTGLLERSAQFRDFLQAQSPDYFEQANTYTHRNGNRYTNINAQMILHCLQHGSYHRGQIVTMARELGLTDVPNTDYMGYVRKKDMGQAV